MYRMICQHAQWVTSVCGKVTSTITKVSTCSLQSIEPNDFSSLLLPVAYPWKKTQWGTHVLFKALISLQLLTWSVSAWLLFGFPGECQFTWTGGNQRRHQLHQGEGNSSLPFCHVIASQECFFHAVFLCSPVWHRNSLELCGVGWGLWGRVFYRRQGCVGCWGRGLGLSLRGGSGRDGGLAA